MPSSSLRFGLDATRNLASTHATRGASRGRSSTARIHASRRRAKGVMARLA
ncbi:Hypothetical protein A7982_04639 [Minicystis rosea]|nr:Hypothetical protein A7982_04639 [Minicystis rosea]